MVALGEGVTASAIGDRVASVHTPGSSGDQVEIPAEALVPAPDAIDDHTAVFMMQRLTASHFPTDFYLQARFAARAIGAIMPRDNGRRPADRTRWGTSARRCRARMPTWKAVREPESCSSFPDATWETI